MARSSSSDPIDKFRFQVVFLQPSKKLIDLSNPTSLLYNNQGNEVAGFSEVTLPKITTSEILYRENLDGFFVRKIAALATYDPIILRRGVTSNTDLYSWMMLTSNDSASINTFAEAASDASVSPFYDYEYRKDIVISSLNRDGSFLKHWVLFDAWASGYKGGNDFTAESSEKLIQELTVTYEVFVEVSADSVEQALKNVEHMADVSVSRALAVRAIALGASTVASFTPF